MAGFGSQFASQMAVSFYDGKAWARPELKPLHDFGLHPGTHVLHYGSTCFEGLKAYRHNDGGVYIFRLDRHIARLRRSAALLCMPQPATSLLEQMISTLVDCVRSEVPEYPSSLYLRPLLFGADANIGNAATPSVQTHLCVMASPVGEYFDAGERSLKLLISSSMRTTPEFGEVKTGGNYASALRHCVEARNEHGADTVLFCPGGDVQETGAANFLLINDERIITKQLDGSILPGITRASILEIGARAGYAVEERNIGVDELLDFAKTGEAAVSGTAAVLTGVGTLLHEGTAHTVGNGQTGPNTLRLRKLLNDIQSGAATDDMGWLHRI